MNKPLSIALIMLSVHVGTATGQSSPVSSNGVLNATQFAGVDIGAQVNNAWASVAGGCGTVFIPRGSYNFSTSIVMSKPCQSLVGDGVATTILNYKGTEDAIRWQMNPFTIFHAGTVRDFTLIGTPSGLSGIHNGSTVGSSLQNVWVRGFTGANGKCIHTENVNGGWYERNTWVGVELGTPSSSYDGCTYDWYIDASTGTGSLGYNHILSLDMNVSTGTEGIYIAGTSAPIYWYNGELNMHCNAAGGKCLHNVTGNVSNLLVSLTGEGPGFGVFLEKGTGFTGCGNIAFGSPSVAVTDLNSPSSGVAAGGFYLGQCNNPMLGNYGGIVSNWESTGHAAALFPVAVLGSGNPRSYGFGVAFGANIGSPFTVMYCGAPNYFSVRSTGALTPWSSSKELWKTACDGSTFQTGQIISGLATGTPPLSVASTTPVANLTLSTAAQAQIFSASLTTSAATTDVLALTGVTASSHCGGLTPTNRSAAANVATTFISAKGTNSVTVTHVATPGMTYDLICTKN